MGGTRRPATPQAMLVAFPVSLLTSSFVFELLGLRQASFATLVAGTLAAAAAAPFVYLEFRRLPRGSQRRAEERARMVMGLVLLAAAGLDWYIRSAPLPGDRHLALVVSAMVAAAAVAIGWFDTAPPTERPQRQKLKSPV
jgi:hypothetical protein